MKRICGALLGRSGLSRFLQLRFNTFLMRWLPACLVRAYIGLLGRVYYFFACQEKETIKQNLSAVISRFPVKQPTEHISVGCAASC